LEQELISTQKGSALLSRNSTTRQKNVIPWNRNSSQRRRSLLFGAGNSTTRQKNAVPWNRNSSQRRMNLPFGTGTQPLGRRTPCSLEQELISTQKNSVL
jgi:hypothetical protein